MGLAVGLVTEAKNLCLGVCGRALTAQLQPLGAARDARLQRGMLRGVQRWLLVKMCSWGTLPQARESVQSGPDGRFYKGPSPFGIDEAFKIHCSQCEQNADAVLSCLQNQSMHYGI